MTNKADLARFDMLHRIGCLCCRRNGTQVFPAEIHHLLSGGRRRGHQFSLPLCVWHHRGVVPYGLTSMQMTVDHGPSLARGSKAFHVHFGSDETLLLEVNELIYQMQIRLSISSTAPQFLRKICSAGDAVDREQMSVPVGGALFKVPA